MYAITTRAFHGTLFEKFKTTLPTNQRFERFFIHNADGFEGAFDFLWSAIYGPFDKIIICDLDCFVWDWVTVYKLALEDIDFIVSERDIPHRLALPEHIGNPFFWILDTYRARIALRDVNKEQIRLAWQPYDPDNEPFWGLYDYLYNKKNLPYQPIPVRTLADNISTESDFFVHTWYSREYGHDPAHTTRINDLFQWAQNQK